MQVDRIKPLLEAPGTILLKLRCDGPLSNVAFKLNLRRYIEGVCADAASFDISATHLAAAVGEAQEAFEIAAADEAGAYTRPHLCST